MHVYQIRRRRCRHDLPAQVQSALKPPSPKPIAVTVLEPDLRSRVDNGTSSAFKNFHASSLADATALIRESPARVLLLSASIMQNQPQHEIARAVRQTPEMIHVVLTHSQKPVPRETLLDLGAAGIKRIVDIDEPSGWYKLRSLTDNDGGSTATVILKSLFLSLEPANDEIRTFFVILVHAAPRLRTVRRVCNELGVLQSTLVSRFFRAGLPSPKSYLASTRLLYAASLLEAKKRTISETAESLCYPTSQSFGRHLRQSIGLTASEFRERYSLAAGLVWFKGFLIHPYLETLREFRPIRRTSNQGC